MPHSALRARSQPVLSFLRDEIADATNSTSEEVQNKYEWMANELV